MRTSPLFNVPPLNALIDCDLNKFSCWLFNTTDHVCQMALQVFEPLQQQAAKICLEVGTKDFSPFYNNKLRALATPFNATVLNLVDFRDANLHAFMYSNCDHIRYNEDYLVWTLSAADCLTQSTHGAYVANCSSPLSWCFAFSSRPQDIVFIPDIATVSQTGNALSTCLSQEHLPSNFSSIQGIFSLTDFVQPNSNFTQVGAYTMSMLTPKQCQGVDSYCNLTRSVIGGLDSCYEQNNAPPPPPFGPPIGGNGLSAGWVVFIILVILAVALTAAYLYKRNKASQGGLFTGSCCRRQPGRIGISGANDPLNSARNLNPIQPQYGGTGTHPMPAGAHHTTGDGWVSIPLDARIPANRPSHERRFAIMPVQGGEHSDSSTDSATAPAFNGRRRQPHRQSSDGSIIVHRPYSSDSGASSSSSGDNDTGLSGHSDSDEAIAAQLPRGQTSMLPTRTGAATVPTRRPLMSLVADRPQTATTVASEHAESGDESDGDTVHSTVPGLNRVPNS